MIIGIDASRNRSGGAVNYLLNIISNFEKQDHFSFVHLWVPSSIANLIPDVPWLQIHSPYLINCNIFSQLFWQKYLLPYELKKHSCDLLFTTDSTTLCSFQPNVIFNQDILAYEPNILNLYPYGLGLLRLYLIKYIQNKAFKRANGIIFLSQYSSKLILDIVGSVKSFCCIPHGVDNSFSLISPLSISFSQSDNIVCTYVSNAEFYKNQITVIDSISHLRSIGYNISCNFVGGGSGPYHSLFIDKIRSTDPDGSFISNFPFVEKKTVSHILSSSHIFIFASSCEAWGITLVEGMLTGLPIACSNKSSLPEVLGSGGVYFDPTDHLSISSAIERIINDPDLRCKIVANASIIAKNYSWERCSSETFQYLFDSYTKYLNNIG